MVVRNIAIMFKMSVSDMFVSSKPGVSIRVTFLLSRSNEEATSMRSVHDIRPLPTVNVELEAKLIN